MAGLSYAIQITREHGIVSHASGRSRGWLELRGLAPKGLSKWAKEGYQFFMLGYVIDGNVEKLKARIDEMKSLVDK